MNDLKNSSNGLLVLKLKGAATADLIDSLLDVITPTAEALGMEPLVLPPGADVELHSGTHALLERVCVALEALVKQGEPPELSEAQIAPQALNARQALKAYDELSRPESLARTTGLNTRG